ncbi:MAG: tRNA lysidine(34) synthetase TilS, partial [candidate division KSB1 bacterium]|nr:tRNA lysidine(34) synthetase TilS [candidate division KSB1 bacterium]
MGSDGVMEYWMAGHCNNPLRQHFSISKLHAALTFAMDLLRQFRQHCSAHELVHPGDRLLLAVSGGLDSRVMLDLFCRLNNEWQWQLQLAVGHVNHQLRGLEADEDEAFVKTLTAAAGVPFFSQRLDVPAYAHTRKISLETAARELRYQTLETFRQNWQARAMVIAHTRDDQAETILDHLLRGSGLAGLAGMPPLRQTILRPLLPFSRNQLEEYARRQNLSWREDRTNVDASFRRNRIRHELLPLLKTRFNPQIVRHLERLARIAGAAEEYFRTEAETRLSEVVKHWQRDKIILDIEQFWKYFLVIRLYVVRAVIRHLTGESLEPTFAETARILDLIQSAACPSSNTLSEEGARGSEYAWIKGKRFIWRNRIEVLIDHDGAVFHCLEGRNASQSKHEQSQQQLVTIGERCLIPGTTMALLIERKILPPNWRQQVNANSQFIDAEKVKGPLYVRFAESGDRFVPLQSRAADKKKIGSKKLSDLFIDLKIPRHRRNTVPILECG